MRIPGINSKNINRILTKVTDLCDLCMKTEEELGEILENSKSAKLVYEFLNKSKKDDANFNNELDFDDVKGFFNKGKKTKNTDSKTTTATTSSTTTNKKSIFKSKSKTASSKNKK